jgi:hypothetical protein
VVTFRSNDQKRKPTPTPAKFTSGPSTRVRRYSTLAKTFVAEVVLVAGTSECAVVAVGEAVAAQHIGAAGVADLGADAATDGPEHVGTFGKDLVRPSFDADERGVAQVEVIANRDASERFFSALGPCDTAAHFDAAFARSSVLSERRRAATVAAASAARIAILRITDSPSRMVFLIPQRDRCGCTVTSKSHCVRYKSNTVHFGNIAEIP